MSDKKKKNNKKINFMKEDELEKAIAKAKQNNQEQSTYYRHLEEALQDRKIKAMQKEYNKS